MLFVLFHLGKDRYALEAGRVVEIVPLLALKKFPQSPRGLAGMFIYHGRPVPALDLCALTLGRPAVEHLSTRILIVNYNPGPGPEQLVGLIAERATETIRRDPKEFVSATGQVAAPPFLGPMLTDEHGVIQLINPEKILQERIQALLFAPPMEADHAPH
jgi:chemotaxis-related protein WspB